MMSNEPASFKATFVALISTQLVKIPILENTLQRYGTKISEIHRRVITKEVLRDMKSIQVLSQ